jgi:class 3 adenylate cyclase
MDWFDTFFAGLLLHSLVIGGLSAWVAWRGWSGEWTAYTYLGSYVLLMALPVYQAGLSNSAAFFPALAPLIFIPIWFDTRKAIFACVLALTMLLAVLFATVWGAPYAPGLIERAIDAQGRPQVMLAVLPLLMAPVIGAVMFLIVVGAAFRREREKLAETRDQLSDALGLISKYVPAELASGILSGTEAPSGGYRRQKVTSFFSDIVGFTELAEEMEPEDLALMLNAYFTEMAEIAERHRGTVDELQGDGLILIFGAPTFRSDREHALDAVEAAAEMQRAITGLNERWQRDGLDVEIQVRMGINTGVVTVGHFGTGNRLKYTVLGKHVNLAARVQAICQPSKVLISHATWLLVKEQVMARSLGEREFKGITRPVEVHELV